MPARLAAPNAGVPSQVRASPYQPLSPRKSVRPYAQNPLLLDPAKVARGLDGRIDGHPGPSYQCIGASVMLSHLKGAGWWHNGPLVKEVGENWGGSSPVHPDGAFDVPEFGGPLQDECQRLRMRRASRRPLGLLG